VGVGLVDVDRQARNDNADHEAGEEGDYSQYRWGVVSAVGHAA